MKTLLVLLGIFAFENVAAAGMCKMDDMAWGDDTVEVYVHYDPNVTSGPGMGLRYAWNMSEVDVEYAVIRAINILNEEGGGRKKLQYAGTRTSNSLVQGGIILYSQECTPNGYGAITNRYHGPIYWSEVDEAEISWFHSQGIDPSCTPITWDYAENSAFDVVGSMLHEFGHAFYGVDHPDGDAMAPCPWNGEPTIMRANSGDWPLRHRVIKDWDRWTFQDNHGSRGPDGGLFNTWREAGGWRLPGEVTSATGSGFLYRPGSLGDVAIRNIGFLHHYSTTPLVYGVGKPRNGRYNAQGFAAQDMQTTNNLFRPVATASKPGTNIVLVAYIKNVYAPGSLDADIGYVCWRRSTDTGVLFGVEQCGATWKAYRNGLTAQYSSQSNKFLIGYAGDKNKVSFGVVTDTGNIWVPSQFGLGVNPVITSATSWHAPALACKLGTHDAKPCRMALESMTNQGCLQTIDFGFDTQNDAYVFNAGVQPSPCRELYDTPGLVFAPSINSFVMAQASKNDAIFAYVSAYGQTTWSGYGDIWNSTGSYVLSAVLGFKPSWPNKVQAYFVKY